MYGTLTGTISGTIYYLYFQLLGIALICYVFRREAFLSKLLAGSVSGSLLATWLPVLFSFCFDFTLLSHILALLLTIPMFLFTLFQLYSRRCFKSCLKRLVSGLKKHIAFVICFVSVMLLWSVLLHTHTLLPLEDGSLGAGQCTYGDMNMHLSFITSLAVQQAFPPDYSIMPGVRLSYPFLSDSISSSLLLFGASLRAAYILPMLFAMSQILAAVYLFASAVLTSLYGKATVSGVQQAFLPQKKVIYGAILVLGFFFLNGGLGFSYFTDWSSEQTYRFPDIFTGFYTTPTNLVNQNIRWVNLIADMLLPQRATLFGYAVLFPSLWLLYKAAFTKRIQYFSLAGLFAASLPMIHTHSFLSACIISAVWMLLWLWQRVLPGDTAPSGVKKVFSCPGAWILALFTILMCLIQYLHSLGKITSNGLMLMGICPFAAALVLGILLLNRYVRHYGWRELLQGWGSFLACLLLLALPQLLFWTFGQVARGGFVRGYFNWGNRGDFYPWFYLKNIGAPLVLIIGAACACDKKRAPLFLPALFLWWLGELIVFTPNPYDNNKLLYAAYLLLCIGAADYAISLYERIRFPETVCRMQGSIGILAALFLFFATFSAILTLGREVISQYWLYSTPQVKLAEYVAENTAPPNAVFLTGTRHNNEIASLSGRSIVCGSDSYLYYHGLDTTERRNDLKLMYEAPLEHMDLFEKYNVSYVVISSYERGSYNLDETAFQACFTELFSCDDIVLYQVPDVR